MTQTRVSRNRHVTSREEARPRGARLHAGPVCVWCGESLREAPRAAVLCVSCELTALQAVDSRLSEMSTPRIIRRN